MSPGQFEVMAGTVEPDAVNGQTRSRNASVCSWLLVMDDVLFSCHTGLLWSEIRVVPVLLSITGDVVHHVIDVHGIEPRVPGGFSNTIVRDGVPSI